MNCMSLKFNITYLLFYFTAAVSSIAQNEPYLGGNGRGDVATQLSTEYLDGTTATPYRLNFFNQPPPTTYIGNTFNCNVEIIYTDSTRVTTASNAITLSIGYNPGNSTLSGTAVLNVTNGLASYTGLGLNNPGTDYTLTASASGFSNITSHPFDIYSNIYLGGVGRGDDVDDTNATLLGKNAWVSTTTTDWATTSNWMHDQIPAHNENVLIAEWATKNLHLDQSRTIRNLDFNHVGLKVVLNDVDLTITGDITSADASNYIRSNGTGNIKRTVNQSQALEFPIGNSTYNPLTITNNSGSSDLFSVRVSDQIEFPTSFLSLASYVNRTWNISKANPNGGPGVDLIFNWNDQEEVGTLTIPVLNHHNGSVWEVASPGTNTSSLNTLTYTGYTGSFSPFAIADQNTPLPVELDYLITTCHQYRPVIQWQTFSEINNDYFLIEQSDDQNTWEKLDIIDGAGNSNQMIAYQFEYTKPLDATLYIRLKQVDYNGTTEIIGTKSLIPCDDESNIQVYPNPTHGEIHWSGFDALSSISIINQFGITVSTFTSSADGNGSEIISVSPGVYYIQGIKNKTITTEKLIVY